MRLIDAPVGLFEHNGNLALKTEYSTIHKDGTSTPDCYLVESGEYFWGGAKTAAERNDLEVKPIRQNCGNCDWYAVSCGTCYNPNADRLLKMMSHWKPYMDMDNVREAIKKMPTIDAVPVVRCPQCIHHEDNGYHFCNKWEHFLPDDSAFFCAFGKRKEANT